MEHIPEIDYDNVRIFASRIKNQRGDPIGLGLIAKLDIIHRGKGTYICSYLGKIVDSKEAKKKNYTSRYVLVWGKKGVDGEDFFFKFWKIC